MERNSNEHGPRVDDQVEGLDDNTLLYGMPRSGADATVSDI